MWKINLGKGLRPKVKARITAEIVSLGLLAVYIWNSN